MTTPQPTAVLVIGGGPAGLAAAAELSLHGISCIVLEPRAQVSHRRPRAKTTNVRTMEHLRRWGVAEALRAAAPLPVAWSQRVTFCESLAGARITDFDGAFGLTTQRDDRFAEAGQQVPQPVVEEVLRAHLSHASAAQPAAAQPAAAQPAAAQPAGAQRPGPQHAYAELRLGHRATSLTQDEAGVTVAVADAAGAGYQLRARYVLGCDGASGMTREAVGARYAGGSDSRPNFNMVFRAPALDTHLGPAVQYWVVGAGPAPASGLIGRLDLAGTWWAGVPGVDPEYGAAHAAELICGLAGAPVDHELLATDPWTARMLVADTFRDRRVFLVGESAHVNPPWGGHGFNTCVGDAVNIAWKIAAVEHGWATDALLASYEPERRAVIEQTVASAVSNMAVLPNVLPRDEARIQQAKRSEFYTLGLVLGYSYAGSPVIQPVIQPAGQPGAVGRPGAVADVSTFVPGTEPGSRLPHHWLPDGSSLYDHLGRGFTLLVPGGVVSDLSAVSVAITTQTADKALSPLHLPPGAHPGVAELAGRARRLGIPLTVTPLPPGYPWPAEFLLVRPDQHIAWRAAEPTGLDIETAAGLRSVRAGV